MTLPSWCSKLKGMQAMGKGMLIVFLLVIFFLVVYPQVTTKQVVLVVDGEAGQVLTRAETVGQVLAESDLFLRESDLLTPTEETRLKRGMEIRLQRAVPLFVHADGQTSLVYSTAATTAELLSELGVSVGQSDRVVPGLKQQLAEGAKVLVSRVRREIFREEVAIPFKTQHVNDPELASGRRRVVVAGKPGAMVRSYEIIYVDGQEEERSFIEEKRVSEPINSVVYVGTKKVAPVITASARGGRVSKVIEGLASWYGPGFQGNRTAYGDIFDKNKLTAASPSREMAGKMVRVTYLRSGRSVDVLINDYGPHIPGRVIDLSMAAARAIGMLSSGVGKVRVKLLE
ncbi:MAG: Endolytic peptidoglycan transglycosylase RlpA [Dehalococcoidia bacterium]|nr:Endolytic peptidoglycan transglycosylase RlpA [Bacillota bacterium]MBT9142709.1 Endolytic peptidoglycan transglycosylase RlpA [Bacillota bacterium]